MTLRSQQTRWFEVFVSREQVVYAIEALAGTESVQLELDSLFSSSLNIEELVKGVREFDRLADLHRSLLPSSAHKSTRPSGPPDDLVCQMLQRLRKWSDRLEPLLAEASMLNAQRDLLQILEEAAIAMGEHTSQLPQLAHTTELLFKRLYRCTARQIKKRCSRWSA